MQTQTHPSRTSAGSSERKPAYPFFLAFAIGAAGCLLFSVTVKEEHAG